MAGHSGPDLGRLHGLSSAERALYARLWAAAGGSPAGAGAPLQGSAVAEVLQRSGLPKDALRHIWELASGRSSTLDFEGFCAACRLCAHAQQMGSSALVPAAISEVPGVPPWFDGLGNGGSGCSGGGGGGGGNCGGGGDGGLATVSTADFDFEASAFGVDGMSTTARPSGPPLVTTDFASIGGPPLGTVHRQEDDFGTRDGGRGGSISGHHSRAQRGELSSYEDEGQLGTGDGIASARKLGNAFASDSRAEMRHPPTERLGRELVERRREVDRRLSDKRRLELRIERARERLDALQEERRAAVIELATRQADVERLFVTLDFSRERIEDTERELGMLREERAAFSPEELARIARKFGSLASGSSAEALAAARAAQELAAADAQGGPQLRERAQRTLRRRADLQARQQLLVSTQQQAERERSYARQELDRGRSELAALQAERLRASEHRFAALEEAVQLAREMGLGSGVVGELIGYTPQAPLSAAAVAASRKALRRGVPADCRGGGQEGPVLGSGSWTAVAESAGGGEEQEVASWWRAKLGTAGSPDAQRGAAAARSAATLDGRHLPHHWAHFEGSSHAAAPDEELDPKLMGLPEAQQSLAPRHVAAAVAARSTAADRAALGGGLSSRGGTRTSDVMMAQATGTQRRGRFAC
mmetsp:Transcript_115728/g.300061  ORF Transcript_115728/g.300061 Transcript_115728/m.300061 type:complete len:651 (+) Transcript_115728:152-2104(+)